MPFLLPRRRVLIVCEDAKSSPSYFGRMRSQLDLSSVEVEVYGKECGIAPINVVDHAINRKKQARISPIRDDYDEIFCIIDVDTHRTLADAQCKARDNKLSVILSNPCFEYWYILHFRRTGKPYHSSREAVSDLRSDVSDYDKGNMAIFEVIYPHTNEAIKRSRDILRTQYHDEEDLTNCNPSTHVHRVVECMQEISSQAKSK